MKAGRDYSGYTCSTIEQATCSHDDEEYGVFTVASCRKIHGSNSDIEVLSIKVCSDSFHSKPLWITEILAT
jgi:hypothetical protein